ncbi:hypothetical protein [Nocardia sp.]|uniref:hypothetical protein n=1 Tax=Nocardia sp. TaxID=1821 RepID=UPI00262106B3|nr:hypothetical protein [Nocardia sp.]
MEYLAFAARRLASSPIVMLLAHQDPIGRMLRGYAEKHLTELVERSAPAPAEPTIAARAYEYPSPAAPRGDRRSA